MILKGVANRGVKLLGTEVGAWLVDGINNDFQIIKNLVSQWTTITTGTIGGSATVAADTITLQQGTNSIWMAAYAPIPTVIGQVYSVSANTIDTDTGLVDIGAATTAVANPNVVNMDLGYTDASNTGLNTLTFTATGTTSYIYLITGGAATTYAILKNEVEIRHAEIITGAELVANGDFATDTVWAKGTGWTISGGTATHAAGTASSIDQTISLVAGESYLITYTVSAMTAGLIFGYISGGTSVNGTTRTVNGTYTQTLIAVTGNNNVGFECNAAFDGSIDDVTVRLAIPDLSSVNMGLGIYGSLNKHVVDVNADTVSYSGFSATDYALQPYNSNLDFGTGDFHFSFWVKSTTTATSYIFLRYPGSGPYIGCYISSTGIIQYHTIGLSSPSISDITDNVWHHVVMNRTSNIGQIYIDAAIELSSADVVDLTNTIAPLYIGVSNTLGSPAVNTEIDLLHGGAVGLTETQVKNIYNKEKILFERDSVHQVVDLGLDLNIERPSAINETPGGIRSSIPSDDGTARESIFQRRQKTHSASSGPVEQKSVKYITNFLDTVNEGQAFSYDPYGTENAPCDPKFVWLESASYQPVRDGDTNWFTTSWIMLERNQ